MVYVMTVITQDPQERTDLLARIHRGLQSLFGSEPAHVVCLCMPRLTLCGAFYDGELSDEPVNSRDCQDCLKVRVTGCLNCGCPGGQNCHLCKEK